MPYLAVGHHVESPLPAEPQAGHGQLRYRCDRSAWRDGLQYVCLPQVDGAVGYGDCGLDLRRRASEGLEAPTAQLVELQATCDVERAALRYSEGPRGFKATRHAHRGG